MKFNEFLQESINDTGIFKAVFVIGIPAAGKSYTISKISGDLSPRIVNTDRAVEFLSKRLNMIASKETWEHFQDSARTITTKSLSGYVNGMLPLFVDGTSNDVSNILHRMGILESVGYDIGVVFVKCDLDLAIKRAHERMRKIGRKVDEEFIRSVAKLNKENADYLRSKVSFYQEVSTDDLILVNEDLQEAYKKCQKFFKSPVKNVIGKRTIEKLKESKEKYLAPTIITTQELDKKIEGWYRT